MSLPTLAYPGLLLGPSSQFTSGAGTHLHASSIYASIAGRPTIISPSPKTASASINHSSNSATNPSITKVPSGSIAPTLSVLPEPPPFSIPSLAVSSKNTLPAVGSVVLCRVTRLTVKQANVAILVVGEEEQNGVCADEWAGVVRREDIRGMERDKVKVQASFKVGDLLRGEVVSSVAFALGNGTNKGEETICTRSTSERNRWLT